MDIGLPSFYDFLPFWVQERTICRPVSGEECPDHEYVFFAIRFVGGNVLAEGFVSKSKLLSTGFRSDVSDEQISQCADRATTS